MTWRNFLFVIFVLSEFMVGMAIVVAFVKILEDNGAMRNQAIKRGYASYVVNDRDELVFQWKDGAIAKAEGAK